MGDAYPDLQQVHGRVATLIEAEEQRFVSTLEAGMARFESALANAAGHGGVLAGNEVFTLYDTYGFPPELTAEMAQDRGVRLDMDGFRNAMEEQRERARAGAAFRERKPAGSLPEVAWADPGNSTFVGYERTQDESALQVLRWRQSERRADDAQDGLALSGEVFELVLESTPFYATAGGQVADQGVLTSDDFIWRVIDVQRNDDSIVHVGVLVQHPAELQGWDDMSTWLRERGPLRPRVPGRTPGPEAGQHLAPAERRGGPEPGYEIR